MNQDATLQIPFLADLNDYCEEFSSKEEAVLKELDRQTHIQTTAPHMNSGHLQGVFLQFISLMLRPKAVLEIGTFTGYSAICLAKGLAEDGILHTIDIDEEKESFILSFFEKAHLQDKIKLHIGDATQIISELDIEFDLVFIDADKENYALYYDICLPKVKKGGFLLVDNVLWKGKILTEPSQQDKKTAIVHAFNKKIAADERIEKVILPFRDGITLIRKK